MRCESCGLEAPTKSVQLHQNIGMLMMRTHQSVSGNLCKSCIDSYFWRYTLTNLTLGWWGLISSIMTPVFIVNNLVQFIRSRGLGEIYTGADAPAMSATSLPQARTQCPHCQSLQSKPTRLPGALFATGVVCVLLLLWSIAVEVTSFQGRGAPGSALAGVVILAIAFIVALGIWMALRYRMWQCQQCNRVWVPRRG